MALARRRLLGMLALTAGSFATGSVPALAAPLVPLDSAQSGITPPRPADWNTVLVANSARGGQRDTAESAAASAPSIAPVPGASAVRIGLQAGHYRTEEMPAPFTTQTGAVGRGKREAEVTLPIAQEAGKVLSALGYRVDVLPAGITVGYHADLVVAIHCDGGPVDRRGYFVDTSFRAPTRAAEVGLAAAITKSYLDLGIPNVFRGTENSRYYYGYYRVDASTPMVLIETGFLTNPTDQNSLIDRPDLVGARIAGGIADYLRG